jgi:predicted HicB family RNase H-like nuclease
MWVFCYHITMSRISIDVSTEDHQKLKALAALQGKSIKDYVLERALGSPEQDEIKALAELESFLDDRIRQTEQKGISSQSVEDVFQSVCREKGLSPSNA